MRILSRRSRAKIDERDLLDPERSAEVAPPALDGREAEPWSADPEQRRRLVEALAFYAEHKLRLRGKPIETPAFIPAIAATIDAVEHGRVVLMTPDHVRVERTVRQLLDANVVFAKLAGFTRSWQTMRQHEWSEWDRAVAWAEEHGDAHGGLFDPPSHWRDLRQPETPLFGWALDLVQGPRMSEHGVPVVRLLHPDTKKARSLPLFDVVHCFRRGQSPEERLRSRPIRSSASFDQGWVRRVSFLDRTLVVDRIPRFDGEAPEVLELTFDEALQHNPDLKGVLATLTDHTLTELRRRFEAHHAAGGSWVLDGQRRLATGRTRLPLTGWHLARDAFSGLVLGEVALEHPRASVRVVVSPREALDAMRVDVPATERLFGDPCVGPDGPCFLRGVDPGGCLVTPDPEAPPHTAVSVPHATWVRANPDLIDALLEWMPDLGVRAEDPELLGALRELAHAGRIECKRVADVLETPVPITDSPVTRALAAEVLGRAERGLPVRWRDRDGTWWRWASIGPEGRFLFIEDRHAALSRALWGPDANPDRTFWHPGATPIRLLRLAPSQLVFAHPRLARVVREYQDDSGLLDPSGRVATAADRITANILRAQQALSEAMVRTGEHLALSATLSEGPRRARVLEEHLIRLRRNLEDLQAGRGLKAWNDEDHQGRIGMGLAVGGVAHGARRAGDDRLRLTDGIISRRLGRFRVALVGGGDTFYDEPSGPLVARLLEEIEGRIAVAVHDAVDLDEAFDACLEAITEASDLEGRDRPFCSLVAMVTHMDSGQAWLAWSGNSTAWRYRGSGHLDRLTWDHTVEGLVRYGIDAGLKPADAVNMVLMLTLQRVQRRDIEAVGETDLVKAAERYRNPSRRRAIRAALGGAPRILTAEHERLLALLATYDEAYGGTLRYDEAVRGARMLFSRRLKVRPGERIVLATDGLDQQVRERSAEVCAALDRPEPQRVVEWLVELNAADGNADDLAIIVVDPLPSTAFETGWTRRKGRVHRRVEEQAELINGGAVEPLPDGSLPALLVVPNRLSRYYGEIEVLQRRRKLPAPDRHPAGFAEGIARWALARESSRPPLKREGELVRGLHDVLEESDDDPLDETLITWFQLRRRGVKAKLVRGLRIEKRGGTEQITDTCWLSVPDRRGDSQILDLGLGAKPVLRAASAFRERAGRLGGGWVLSNSTDSLEYLPDRRTWVEIPEPEVTVDSDPWLRLHVLGRGQIRTDLVEPRQRRPARESGGHAAPAQDDKPEAAPVPASTGWLDLDL